MCMPAIAKPLPHYNALIKASNQQAIAADILAIGCMEFPLDNDTKKMHCQSPHGTRLELARTVDPAIQAARKSILKHISEADTEKLRTLSQKVGFHLASPIDKHEALALYDFMVNQVIIKQLLQGLNKLLDAKSLDHASLANFAKEAANMAEVNIHDAFYTQLRTILNAAVKKQQNIKKILYASFGCGSASKDIQAIRQLREEFLKHHVTAYCIDPYQSAKNHPITEFGVLDTKPLRDGESLRERIRMHINDENIMVLTGHYAFHHLGQSFGYFRKISAGIPTLLYETIVDEHWFSSFIPRQRTIAYDILMNHGFDHATQNDWVASAAKKNASFFQVYYLSDTLNQQPEIQILPIEGSKNAIVSY